MHLTTMVDALRARIAHERASPSNPTAVPRVFASDRRRGDHLDVVLSHSTGAFDAKRPLYVLCPVIRPSPRHSGRNSPHRGEAHHRARYRASGTALGATLCRHVPPYRAGPRSL